MKPPLQRKCNRVYRRFEGVAAGLLLGGFLLADLDVFASPMSNLGASGTGNYTQVNESLDVCGHVAVESR